jgi:hypothetical protein
MASLSGNKIKDTFNLLLKLQSSEASATEQVVEDGAGNDTALKISTDTVETTGSLKDIWDTIYIHFKYYGPHA